MSSRDMTNKRRWLGRMANWGLGLGFGLTGLALAQVPVVTQLGPPVNMAAPSDAEATTTQPALPANSAQSGGTGPSVGLALVSCCTPEAPKATDNLVPMP